MCPRVKREERYLIKIHPGSKQHVFGGHCTRYTLLTAGCKQLLNLFASLCRDSQMKTTWLSTNTNMRWPWSLALQGMTLLSLLVSDISTRDWCCTLQCQYWRFSSTADQTPTPTRFLKNCEEVGLFNELASPFDHDFKKASEDDIKKVALIV